MDNFVVKPGQPPQPIAPRPLVARLPQKMLAHPQGGALAVLGHVDRAWPTSFTSPRVGPQLQGFRDVIGRILRGDRLGQATDQFDVRRAALSFELSELQRRFELRQAGPAPPDRRLVARPQRRPQLRDPRRPGRPAPRGRYVRVHVGRSLRDRHSRLGGR